jgi:hypothetical protein
MSLVAELQPPLLSYNFGGQIFKQGQALPVGVDVALKLAKIDVFKVTGLDTREAVEAVAQFHRPEGDELMQAIVDAQEDMDVTDESNLDKGGQLSVHALSAVLGYKITVEERNRALYPKTAPVSAAAPEALEEAAEKTATPPRAPLVIPKKPAAKPTPAEDPTTQGAILA